MEDTLCEAQTMRQFSGIIIGNVLDESIIKNFEIYWNITII